jgi:hypothetical protein
MNTGSEPMDEIMKFIVGGGGVGLESHITTHLQIQFQNGVSN